jgi:hypothetical protein
MPISSRPAQSGGYLRTGADRGCPPVIEATDVGDPMAPYGQDLPALDRSSSLASGRRAGDFQPDQKSPGTGDHLGDHRCCTGGSRAGPPRHDLVAVAAVGVVGTIRRAPAGTAIEQIPDGI